MFSSTISPIILEEEERKYFEFVIFLFSFLCIKSNLVKLRGHKVVPVISHILTFFSCLVCSELLFIGSVDGIDSIDGIDFIDGIDTIDGIDFIEGLTL